MPTPNGQGGDGHASGPPTPASSYTNAANHSGLNPFHQNHATNRNDHTTASNQIRPPSTPRGPSKWVPGRPLRQNMPPIDGGGPAPSALGKRSAGPVADNLKQYEGGRAAKRPANASTISELEYDDAPVAQRGMSASNTNEAPPSAEVERQEFIPRDDAHTRATDTSMSPRSVENARTSADGTRDLTSQDYRNVSWTGKPVPTGPSARPKIEPGLECRACGSRLHMTKNCHVPSSDGTVVICPFHDCSVLDRTNPLCHPLDGLTRHQPGDRLRTPLYCTTMLGFKTAASDKNTAKTRQLLPLLFQTLVVNRKRKPFCRVVQAGVCPINIAIMYSLLFFNGEMPPQLQGVWPYTMRDATDPAILAKLEQYDELGWEGMPPGELEAKSWEEIVREYADGTISPQIRGARPKYWQTGLASSAEPTTAARAGTEGGQTDPGTELEIQTVDEDGGSQGSRMDEGADQSRDTTKLDVLHRIVDLLSQTVDTLSEKKDALSEQKDVLYKILDAMP